MEFYLHCIAIISLLVRVLGTNSFRSGDLAALDMIELKNVRINDPLGQTRLVTTFQECVGVCLSLSYCLSFSIVKSKADEWLCHATRYNYTDVLSRKDLQVFNNSYIYAFNDRSNISRSRPGPSSCDEFKISSKRDVSGVYLIDLQSDLVFNTDCKIKYILPECVLQFGDGIGGTEVKQIGRYSKPEDCILKCAKQRNYNGVTIAIGFGKECWCEKNMTGRNTNDVYMSCKFNGELQAYISELNPIGSSCDQLRKSPSGLGSGVYSITLNSNNKIKVHCLMEFILPGGWLEVARLNTTKHGNFLLEEAESDNITNLEQVTMGKFALTQFGLRALKNETNFTHIRFQCSKSSHNRILDIATNKSDVINWLLGYTNSLERPASCASYYVLPGDSSLISKVCNQWGYTGKWGHATNNVPLLWTFVMYTHMQQHWLFGSRRDPAYTSQHYCDDFNAPGSSGVWRMFVK